MAVAGASRFLNSATLANLSGQAPTASSVLGTGDTLSLLGAAKNAGSVRGIGLSASSRAQTEAFLSQSASGFNQIFSLSGVEFGTNETLQQAILALRASVPESKLAPSVRDSLNEDTTEPGSAVDIEA